MASRQPIDLASLVATLEWLCRDFGLSGPTEPLAEFIALKVIEAAGTGERNPERLREHVLFALRCI